MTNQNSHANNYLKISAPLHPRTPLSHQIWMIVKVDSEIIGENEMFQKVWKTKKTEIPCQYFKARP